jgi:hypothetical protein
VLGEIEFTKSPLPASHLDGLRCCHVEVGCFRR